MSPVRYHNQPAASFWESAPNIETQGSPNPFFPDMNSNNRSEVNDGYSPWLGAWGFPFGGPFTPQARQEFLNQYREQASEEPEAVREVDVEKEQTPNDGPSEPRGPPPPFSERPHPWHGAHERRRDLRGREWGGHGRNQSGFGPWGNFGHSSRMRFMGGFWPGNSFGMGGGFGPWGPFWPGNNFGMGGGFGPWVGFRPMGGFVPWGAGLMGGFGPWGNHGPWARFGPFGGFGQMNGFGFEDGGSRDKEEGFKPDVDVFDTPESYIVFVSLSGAKKEDLGVNWDSNRCELNITGATQRPADEEATKVLGQDKNKVGTFEQKVRLGNRANSKQIDSDSITARMEGGVLVINVPKLESGFVEMKKVDIE